MQAVRAKKIFIPLVSIGIFGLLLIFSLVVALYNPQKPVKIKAKDFNTSVEKNEVKKLLQRAFAISAKSTQVLGAETPLEVKKEGSVKKADFSFNAIAPSWQADIPPGSQILIQIRTSEDGKSWSDWKNIEVDDDRADNDPSNKIYGRLIVASAKYFQERTIFKSEDVNLVPSIKKLRLTYIDSKEKHNLIEKILKRVKLKAKQVLAAPGVPRRPTDPPDICSRACWGADESIYVPGEDYASVRKIIIHHTVTANNDSDPAATVRAIYYYHNVGRGWGDIGYNFVIDQNNGTIYEGRRGGDGVIGAHTSGYNAGGVGVAVLGDFRYVAPNKKVQNALHKIVVWKLYSHKIDPNEVSVFGRDGWALPAVFVHGRVANTACAGTYLNNFTPNLIAMSHYLPQQIVLRNAAGVQRIEGNGDQTVGDLLAAYQSQGVVAPNYIRKVAAFPSDGTTPPNDPNYSSQWDLPKLDALNDWKETSGGSSSVKVAVIDTGVAYENYNPSGPENYAKGPDFTDTNFVAGYDFVNGDSHPDDDYGHGTVVASVIAESKNNSLGSASLAYNVSIMPIKVCDSYGLCLDSDVVAGIDFARENGAKVINMSLGEDYYSSTVQAAIDAAWDAGIVVVASVGNESRNWVSYPAFGNHVIGVGALTSADQKAWYSNYGNGLDLVAPGGDGYSGSGNLLYQYLNCTDDLDCTNFTYSRVAGTSLSASFVSASAALMASKGVASPDSIERYLEGSATDIGAIGFDDSYGWGRVNPLSAFGLIGANPSRPNGLVLSSSSDGKAYLLDRGEKRWIKTPSIFEERFRWQDVIFIPSSEMNSFSEGTPLGFPDGTLVNEVTTGKVYEISNGLKRWIINGQVFNGLGYSWQNIKNISATESNLHSAGANITAADTHPDGTLVTSRSTPKVYFIENGQKRWISNGSIFESRFHWKNIVFIPENELNSYPDGNDLNYRDGILIAALGKVFLVSTPTGSSNQAKNWIFNPAAFAGLSFKWGDIRFVTDSFANSLPNGSTIY